MPVMTRLAFALFAIFPLQPWSLTISAAMNASKSGPGEVRGSGRSFGTGCGSDGTLTDGVWITVRGLCQVALPHWRTDLPHRWGMKSNLASDKGTVVMGYPYRNSYDGAVRVLDLTTERSYDLLPVDADLDPAEFGLFGRRVAVFGDSIVVSSYRPTRARVHIFSATWHRHIELTQNEDVSDFGKAVAIDQDVVVVGADRRAYIFSTGNYRHCTLESEDATATHDFGHDVAVDDGVVVIGQRSLDGGLSGAVYTFDTFGTPLSGKILPEVTTSPSFGTAVAIHQGRLVIGEPGQRSAYLVETDGRKLLRFGFDTSDFGSAVAIEGDLMVVAAPGMNEVYVCRYSECDELSCAVLKSENEWWESHRFGSSVAIDQARVVVGGFMGSVSRTFNVPSGDVCPA